MNHILFLKLLKKIIIFGVIILLSSCSHLKEVKEWESKNAKIWGKIEDCNNENLTINDFIPMDKELNNKYFPILDNLINLLNSYIKKGMTKDPCDSNYTFKIINRKILVYSKKKPKENMYTQVERFF